MRVIGANKLIGHLKRGATLDDVKDIVKLNGSEMQRSAHRKAPVDTGNLKRSITLKMEDNGFAARVASEADYAPYQEYGTRFQPGTPHIRPAYNEQRAKFINDLKRVMK